MTRIGLILICIFIIGCSEGWKSENFSHEDVSKNEKDFLTDSKKCITNKDKFSHKIQGRELGFEGEHAGYLGCMKMQGWSRKSISKTG
jgi:hypothetical protein